MRRLNFSWDLHGDPMVSMEVDEAPMPLDTARRIAIVLSADMEEPVVDVSYGTPLPLSLSDDGPAIAGVSPSQFLDIVDVEALKEEVLRTFGGMFDEDPITATLRVLKDWATDVK